MTDLTQDAFLDGRVHLWQPRKGYRAGVDPVLLAASIAAKPGDTVLELGCGAGAASLCLAARIADLSITGVEVQEDYAALARRNATENKADMTVVQADLRTLPSDLRQKQFNHVFMNPPYYDRTTGSGSDDAGRDIAFAGDTPLADWLDVGIKRLAPKGHLNIIQHISRLPEVLAMTQNRLGSLILRPIAGRIGASPQRFLLRGVQAGRGPFVMLPALILHEGAAHTADAESYTPQIKGILRNGEKLDLAP